MPWKIFIKQSKSNLLQNVNEFFAFMRRNFLSYIGQRCTKGCASFFCYLVKTQYYHIKHPVIKHSPTLPQTIVQKKPKQLLDNWSSKTGTQWYFSCYCVLRGENFHSELKELEHGWSSDLKVTSLPRKRCGAGSCGLNYAVSELAIPGSTCTAAEQLQRLPQSSHTPIVFFP